MASKQDNANPYSPDRKHLWRASKDVDDERYFFCQRIRCGIIWAPVHDRNKEEPVGCEGDDPPKSPLTGRVIRRKE